MSDYANKLITATETNKLITATETRDADMLLSLYDQDAQLSIYDKNRPPASPTVLRGTEQIGSMLTNIMSRDMTHRITKVVVSGDGLAWVEECSYPDDVGVVSTNIAILRDGLIYEHILVQVWDGE
jgi:hypothetical protein